MSDEQKSVPLLDEYEIQTHEETNQSEDVDSSIEKEENKGRSKDICI